MIARFKLTFNVIFIFFAFMIFMQGGRAVAQTKPNWNVVELESDTYLFEKPDEKIKALLSITPIDVTNEEGLSYLLSPQFFQDTKNSRSLESMGLSGLKFEVQTVREQVGSEWIGLVTTDFESGDEQATMSERYWIRNKLLFHFLIGTTGVVNASNEDHRRIFNEFTDDLALAKKTARRWPNLIPEAHAGELGTSSGSASRRPRASSWPVVNAGPLTLDCRAQAASLKITPLARARSGPPKMNPELSRASCSAAMNQIYGDVKKYALTTANDLKQRSAANARKLGCQKIANSGRAPVRPSDPWYTRWMTVYSNASVSEMYSNCLSSAGKTAVAQMAGGAVVSTAKAVKRVADKIAPYMGPVGATRVGAEFARYIQRGGNPLQTMYAFMARKYNGFSCLSDQEQSKMACSVAIKAAAEVTSMAVTGGASMALRGLRVARALDEAVEISLTADRALNRANAIGLRGKLGLIGDGVSDAKRLSLTEKTVGRKLSAAESAAVKKAHAVAKGTGRGFGSYTRTDLAEKLRALKAGGFSDVEAQKILRLGIAGEAPTVGESLAFKAGLKMDKSPAEYNEFANLIRARAQKTIARSKDASIPLSELGPETGMHMTKLAGAMSRTITRTDISKVGFADSQSHLELLRVSSHAYPNAARETGQALAQAIREMPVGHRDDYLKSVNLIFESQMNTRLTEAQRAASHGRFGNSLPDIIDSMNASLKGKPAAGVSASELRELNGNAGSSLVRRAEALKPRSPASGSGLKPTNVDLGSPRR